MDQLDLLKKDWKKQDAGLPKYSFDELSKLIHKKSSSIVKWIFVISVLEFVIPHLMLLFIDRDHASTELSMNSLNLRTFNIIVTSVFYLGALFFIYLFYKNYKLISANSNPKTLMQNILKTRKTVKYYIWFALSFIPIVGVAVAYQVMHTDEFLEKIPEEVSMLVVWAVIIAALLFLMLIFWLFYQLLYGILLSRLKKNYNELLSNGQVL